ncbi:MAG: SDR family NAD(P)-dependent oxidoreductase [Pseudomonadota bacterium]|nr:SDR family NAD(P)-dependent oxidoreductase [Pseudomonadota bacterium]
MTQALVHGLASPAHALVTGASSGVGLAVVEELLGRADVAQVFAVSRGAHDSRALAALQATHGERIRPLAADITCEDALHALACDVRAHTDRLHLVFNAAGLLHAPGLRPEKSVTQLRLATLSEVFAVNAFAPVLLAQSMLPLMKHGEPAVLASLSARVGSIGDNRLGGWYSYRASKAAQNQLMRTLSIELRRTHPQLSCVVLHPGTVDTPLSRPFQSNVPADKLFSAPRAAQQLLEVVATMTPGRSGSFVAWDGQMIAW